MVNNDHNDRNGPNRDDRKRNSNLPGFQERVPKRQRLEGFSVRQQLNRARVPGRPQINRPQQNRYAQRPERQQRVMGRGNARGHNVAQVQSSENSVVNTITRTNIEHYRDQVLKSKQEELKKIKSHLMTFHKEKQWLMDKKPYFSFEHFSDFPGHGSVGGDNSTVVNPQLASDLFKDIRQEPVPRHNSAGDYKDLNDPQICSRYRLGIAPVFGDNLIFETPLASLAMSSSTVPDSLPEIEELESRQQDIESQLQELQETIGKRLDPVPEPPRAKTRWDYLLEEMKYMADDFVREQRWKQGNTKKISRAIQKHFEKEETKRKNQAKIERARLKKMSATMSKEVAIFWGKIGKLHKIRTDIDEKIELLRESNEKLEEFVAETEDYAANLKQSLVAEKDDMDIDPHAQNKEDISATAQRMQEIAKNNIEMCDDYRKKTPVPSLLRFGTLRDYQHVGLHWLASLHRNNTNGILADEMGLGKTIQTISLLGHMACVEENWGPHLIVVPSSVIVNWEMEFKRWLPAFKVLSYHGSKKEREAKRAGWSKDNAFHVCITSYNLVVREAKVFRRRRWQYLILDEAHQIKNFESKRWQTLLNFNTQDRLLLTGTPLQNNLNELWSLLHFLMPNVFESQSEFSEWFENPVTGMIKRNQDLASSHIINRLHSVLRPFLLRRQKKDVEKQLPPKHFHTLECRLSRRQRRLYEDFMNADRTKAIMKRSDYMGMMNIVMQLRKVCNHPDLFEGRAIRAPFIAHPLRYTIPSLVANNTLPNPSTLDTNSPLLISQSKSQWTCKETRRLQTKRDTILRMKERPEESCPFPGFLAKIQADLRRERKRFRESLAEINSHRCKESGYEIADIYHAVKIRRLNSAPHIVAREKKLLISDSSDIHTRPGEVYHPSRSSRPFSHFRDMYPTNAHLDMVKLFERRHEEMQPIICKFIEYHPPVQTAPIELHSYHPPLAKWERQHRKTRHLHREFLEPTKILHEPHLRRKMQFPEKRLLQWDCGKLQALDKLLRKLKKGKHRCLIFTQMSKMLNVLEAFLNLYDYRYLRLDGSTKTEDRGKLMHKFNSDESIFVFILSTRSGGLGMNLTGADTVIFYDNDWNPAMDMQAQDRCHRIGQTREVHIYKLMSANTIEENILKKADQKKEIMEAVMGDNSLGMDIFREMDPWELLGMETKEKLTAEQVKRAMELAEDEEDREAAAVAWQEAKMQAEDEMMGDEHRERARWDTAIELLNPVEKYALSFFGEARSPDPTIGIHFLELQCRQLEERLDKDMRYYRELNHLRSRQELTTNADTVELALRNIKLIPGVQYGDVEKLAEIHFKHHGIHRGEVSLLPADDNTRNWGLFSTQEEIDLMLPRASEKRKREDNRNQGNSDMESRIVKRVKTKDMMRESLRIDDKYNIFIPWALLPSRRRPVFQKPRNGLRVKSSVDTKSRPQQLTKNRKRPTKHQTIPFNKREDQWISRNAGVEPSFLEMKMTSSRMFSWKGRSSEMIRQKVHESKNGTLRSRRTEALDMLSHEGLKNMRTDKQKYEEMQKKIFTRINPDSGQSKNTHTLEQLIQKLKQRSSMNPGLINSHNQTPKSVLSQHMQAQEMHRSHTFTMRQRHAFQTNLAVRQAQMSQIYLQQNPALAHQLSSRMTNPHFRMMMAAPDAARFHQMHQRANYKPS